MSSLEYLSLQQFIRVINTQNLSCDLYQQNASKTMPAWFLKKFANKNPYDCRNPYSLL